MKITIPATKLTRRVDLFFGVTWADGCTVPHLIAYFVDTRLGGHCIQAAVAITLVKKMVSKGRQSHVWFCDRFGPAPAPTETISAMRARWIEAGAV